MRSTHLNEATTALNAMLETWRRSQLGTIPAGKAFEKALAFQIQRDRHPQIFSAITFNSDHVLKSACLAGYICISVSADKAGNAVIVFQKCYVPAGPPIVL